MERILGLLIGLIVLFGFYLTMNLLTRNAFGENYTYNMTEAEITDELVTQACIQLQINSQQCDMVYGGILDKVSEGRIK